MGETGVKMTAHEVRGGKSEMNAADGHREGGVSYLVLNGNGSCSIQKHRDRCGVSKGARRDDCHVLGKSNEKEEAKTPGRRAGKEVLADRRYCL